MTARARSSAEMRFAVSLSTCRGCGAPVDPDWLMLEGSHDARAMTGKCGRCHARLAFTFRTHGDPLLGPVRPGELGGTAPSEIISPCRFVAEIDRLVPLVHPEPSTLALDEWIASREANWRVRMCLAELAKFLPEGGSELPESVLSEDDRASRARHPERYTREWIERQRAHHDSILARIVADLPRIEALQRGKRYSRV